MKRAIALHYVADEHDAPVVVSCGEGDLANRIERAAHQFGIAVVRDVPLAQSLADLSVGDAIPESLYESVAAILRELALDPERGGSGDALGQSAADAGVSL